MKKFKWFSSSSLLILLLTSNPSFAENVPLLVPKPLPKTSPNKVIPISLPQKTAAPQPSSQPVMNETEFANCSKAYTLSAENLFLLTMSALSANNYKINEVQSKNGYILFTAEKKEFLATIAKINNQSSSIKITPANNSYSFLQTNIDKIFKYISENIK